MLLADISAARGQPATFSPQSPLPSKDLATPVTSSPPSSTDKMPVDYPFNFILTSATIPSALAAYLDKHHPKLIRLASPNLHHLPKTLQTEYVNWTGGNKNADIERRIRRVWAEDSAFGGVSVGRFANGEDSPDHPPLSKVLVFCNKSTKVNELGEYLADKGIKNIALTSTSDQRKRGSNHHLDGFLRKNAKSNDEDKTSTTPGPDSTSITHPIQRSSIKQDAAGSTTPRWRSNPKEDPHVMITTSLLSRGLDFSPAIRHVFIVDEPRNMIDFLHRAGRSGRAGERGKVVVFGKMKGRGSTKAKDVRRRVGALIA
jgi:ATP-dependent RNA helicase MRH4